MLSTLAMLVALGAPCDICFYGPDNMVFDRSGNVYVTDTDGKSKSRVAVLSPDGKLKAQWHIFTEGRGDRNGPEGIAIASNGSILVTDAGSGSILSVSTNGKVGGTFGGRGSFSNLGHVAVDGDGDVYVAQALPNTIEEFSAEGLLKAFWHRPRGMNANEWTGPESIAVQSGGDLVVEDWGSRRIEILGSHGETIATFGSPGKGHGKFVNTAGVAVDASDDIYVADVGAHCVQRFDPRGRWLNSICNTPGHALFEVGPSSIAVDAKGNLYSADGLSVVKYAQNGTLIARWV